MSGRVIRGGCGPKHLKADGSGWRECEASGFVRKADDFVDDVRQGDVAPEFADITPGFGTHHPQDVKQLGVLDDPSSIYNASPISEPCSLQEQNISDQERMLATREGRAPRRGY